MPDPLALQVHIVGVLNESQESPHGAILLGSPEATRAAAMLLYQDVHPGGPGHRAADEGRTMNSSRLRTLRVAAGLSQEECADRVGGMCGSFWARWEPGEMQFSIAKAARGLGVSPASLSNAMKSLDDFGRLVASITRDSETRPA